MLENASPRPFSHASPKSWSPRFELLDHGRGVAILWVMLFHAFAIGQSRPLHPIAAALLPYFAKGWFGVHLFFVISGYCIAAKVYDLILKKSGPVDFLKSRFWRLMPTYWIALFTAIVIGLAAMPFNHTPLRTNLPLTVRDWIGNLFLLQRVLNVPYLQAVYWSLSAEWLFYLAVAFLFLMNRWMAGRTLLGLAFLGTGALCIFDPPQSFWTSWVDFSAGSLAFGVIWAWSTGRRESFALSVVALLGLWACAAVRFSQGGTWIHFASLSFAIVLVGLYSFDKFLSGMKGLRGLRYLGVISYSLYLMHLTIQTRIINTGIRLQDPRSFAFLATVLAAMAAAIVMSMVFYHYVENPLQKRRRPTLDASRQPPASLPHAA
jgi:peptidoglycan/LPS O-acetylase OafA/YrhL